MQDEVWTRVMNAGLFAHCIFAYVITLNVWTDLALHLFWAAPQAECAPFLLRLMVQAYKSRCDCNFICVLILILYAIISFY